MAYRQKELALFKKLYFGLFGKCEDALMQLDNALAVDGGLDLIGIFRAKEILLEAVTEAEDAYLAEDAEPTERATAEERFAQFTKFLKTMDDEAWKEFLHIAKQGGIQSKTE
ncbi:MAG: hypothetical protein IJV43_03080 [Oscillospiraceae bacterium]|nr:hypothetical protein [Oscillospiraceae bacterium]